MKDCVFCGIVAGDVSAHIVYEDELGLAFLDAAPVNPGHLLVIPRQHIASLASLDRVIGGHLFWIATQMERAVRNAGLSEGINLHLADGDVADQDIPHLHLHVIPRQKGDAVRVDLPCPRSPSIGELEKVWKLLRMQS